MLGRARLQDLQLESPPGHVVLQARRPGWIPKLQCWPTEYNPPTIQEQLDAELNRAERLEDLLNDERTEKQQYQEKLQGLQQEINDQLAAQKDTYEQRMARLQQELQAVQGHKVGHGTMVKAEWKCWGRLTAAAAAGWVVAQSRPGTMVT